MLNQSVRKIINVDSANLVPLYTFKQEDDAVLLLSLFRNSVPLDITGQTITLGIKRPNGTLVNLETLEGDNPFTIDSNNLDIKLKNSVLAVPGLCECDLELVDVNGKMTTASFYITVNRKIISDTNIKATNDIAILEKIKLEEEARETNETNRKESEIARVSAEELREQQETVRGRNEATREEAESIRSDQETIRENNEISRGKKENSREFNEATRNENENARVLKEEERANSENTRNSNEEARKYNEALRIEAETVRASQEDTREFNEVTRNSNETNRKAEEQERVSAEESRKSNELARQTAYKEIEGARKDFNGVTRDNLNERLSYDMGYVNDRFNKASLLEYDSKYISASKSYDGVTRDLKIKGRTLQNLIDFSKVVKLNYDSYTYEDGIITNTKNLDYSPWEDMVSVSNLIKPNTIYTIIVTSMCNFNIYFENRTNSNSISSVTTIKPLSTTVFKKTTESDANGFFFKIYDPTEINKDSKIKLVVLEGDYTNENIPYFEGIKSVGEEGKVDLIGCGKNLFNSIFSKALSKSSCASFDEDNNVVLNGYLPYHYVFDVIFPKGTYIASCKDTNITLHVFWEGGDSGFANNKPTTFEKDTIVKCYISSGTYNNYVLKDHLLERGTVATPYEPYKETRTPITLNAPLRSVPSGACDIEDLENGKIIRRIGKYTFSGNEDIYTWDTLNSPTHCNCYMYTDGTNGGLFLNVSSESLGIGICNSLPIVANTYSRSIKAIGISKQYFSIGLPLKELNLTTENSENDYEIAIKNWLKSNPTTVYYILETPIEEPIILPNNLRTYDGITNIFTEGSLIEPNIYAKIPSDVIALTDIRNSTVKSKIFANADERVEELEQDVKNIVSQEAWITPTLRNGATGTIQYRKNSIGIVEFRGDLTGSAGNDLFNIPVGYRPSINTTFPCSSKTSDGIVLVLIQEGGNIYITYPYGTQSVDIGSIMYLV